MTYSSSTQTKTQPCSPVTERHEFQLEPCDLLVSRIDAELTMNPLRIIGQHHAQALPISLLLAMAIPPLGELLRPFVTEAVFAMLVVAFLRLDMGAAARHIRKPGLLLAATAWTSLAIPGAFVLVSRTIGVPETAPDLYPGLLMQGLASPMMSAPALVALVGLDATLVLMALVLSTAIVPVTAPFFAALSGVEWQITPLQLGIKLMAILVGAFILGTLLRRWLGVERVERVKLELDGINILLMFSFMSAVLGDLGYRIVENALLVAGLFALSIGVFLAIMGVTWLVFQRSGTLRALSLAVMASLRNMGLMLAGVGGVVPEMAWTYFAVSQFPIYLAPWILQQVSRRTKEE